MWEGILTSFNRIVFHGKVTCIIFLTEFDSIRQQSVGKLSNLALPVSARFPSLHLSVVTMSLWENEASAEVFNV
jgi:hypothetical protein